MYCAKYSDSSTASLADLSFHIAKKYSSTESKKVDKCHPCSKKISSFYFLRLDRQKVHGEIEGSEAKSIDDRHILGHVDDDGFEEDLKTCKYFLLNSEMKNERHRIFKFAMDSLSPHELNKILNQVFDSLKCSANLNVIFSFDIKNVENSSGGYLYAQGKGKNTLLGRSKLVATKKLGKISRRCWTLLMWLNPAPEKEQKENGSFSSWRRWRFLLDCSRKFLWGVKLLFCHNHSSKIIQSSAWVAKWAPENHTTIIHASSEIWFSSCTVRIIWKERCLNCFLPIYTACKTLMQSIFEAFFWTKYQPSKTSPKPNFF